MNYRNIRDENIKKSRYVIAFYLLIFVFVGLLGDSILLLSEGNYGDTSLWVIMSTLITFEVFPIVTFIMAVVSSVIVFAAVTFGSKIMLAGSEYSKIDRDTDLNFHEEQLLNIVEELKISSRLRYMPEVYILESNQLNAFASGWHEDNAIVCITRRMLDVLTREEIEAVMAHEMAHIKNADVRLTLIVGILTNIMVFGVDMMFHFFGGNSKEKAAQQIKIILFILKITLPIITFLLQMYLSRKREYMADAGSIEFTGNRDAMISALQKISGGYQSDDDEEESNSMRRFAYIYQPDSLFSTHPSIENRIKAIQGREYFSKHYAD